MASYCPNCGEPVTENNTFCGECGTALDGEEGGGESGWDDTQESGWDDTQNTGQNPQNAGWEGGQGTRGQQQQAPRQGPQGTRRQQQQAPRQGAPGMQGGAGIPRKNAIDTFVQGVKWLVAVPALLGAFIVVDLLGSVGGLFIGLLSLVGSIVSLLVWGAAYKYTEQFVYSGDVQGGVDEVIDTVSEVAGRLLSLIGIFIVYIIAVVVGLVLLILPGIYLAARLVLAFPACVLDEQGVGDSLSTSWEVAGGNVLKLVGLGVLNFVAVFGITIIAGIAAAVVGGLSALEGPLFSILLVPVTALLGGAVQMAIARVYIENRQPAPQPRGQQAGGYQQEPAQTQY
jgi:hypothetical protein